SGEEFATASPERLHRILQSRIPSLARQFSGIPFIGSFTGRRVLADRRLRAGHLGEVPQLAIGVQSASSSDAHQIASDRLYRGGKNPRHTALERGRAALLCHVCHASLYGSGERPTV